MIYLGAPLVALIVWELVAKATGIPTPSSLIRRSTHCQTGVRHFLEPCAACPHRTKGSSS